MRKSELKAPPKSDLSARCGGNGGYSKRAPIEDKPMVRRVYNLRDYHGKKYKGDS